MIEIQTCYSSRTLGPSNCPPLDSQSPLHHQPSATAHLSSEHEIMFRTSTNSKVRTYFKQQTLWLGRPYFNSKLSFENFVLKVWLYLELCECEKLNSPFWGHSSQLSFNVLLFYSRDTDILNILISGSLSRGCSGSQGNKGWHIRFIFNDHCCTFLLKIWKTITWFCYLLVLQQWSLHYVPQQEVLIVNVKFTFTECSNLLPMSINERFIWRITGIRF